MADIKKIKVNGTDYNVRDDSKVLKSGDTMAGDLTFSSGYGPATDTYYNTSDYPLLTWDNSRSTLQLGDSYGKLSLYATDVEITGLGDVELTATNGAVTINSDTLTTVDGTVIPRDAELLTTDSLTAGSNITITRSPGPDLELVISSTGGVSGVKGNNEQNYRTGNVNLTAANIGAAPSTHQHGGSDVIYDGTAHPQFSGQTMTAGIDYLESNKQPTLVSGTNIKTINGTSLLGSGNITIEGAGGDVTGPSSSVNNNIAVFNGTSGKIIKDSGVSTSDFVKKDGSVAMTGDLEFGKNKVYFQDSVGTKASYIGNNDNDAYLTLYNAHAGIKLLGGSNASNIYLTPGSQGKAYYNNKEIATTDQLPASRDFVRSNNGMANTIYFSSNAEYQNYAKVYSDDYGYSLKLESDTCNINLNQNNILIHGGDGGAKLEAKGLTQISVLNPEGWTTTSKISLECDADANISNGITFDNYDSVSGWWGYYQLVADSDTSPTNRGILATRDWVNRQISLIPSFASITEVQTTTEHSTKISNDISGSTAQFHPKASIDVIANKTNTVAKVLLQANAATATAMLQKVELNGDSFLYNDEQVATQPWVQSNPKYTITVNSGVMTVKENY